MGPFRSGRGGSVRVKGQRAVRAVLLTTQHGCSPRRRRASARLAARASLRIPSPGLDTPHSVQSEGARPRTAFDSPALACDALAGGDMSVAVRSALGAPATQGPAVAGRGGAVFHPHPERLALWAWPLSG